MTKGTRWIQALLAAAAALAAPLAGPAPFLLEAQEVRVEEADLPRHVADEVVDYFNDPGTVQFSGRSRIPAERTVVGNVGVLGGPLTVAGRVEGRVVVLNGDLLLEPGAEITGDVLVLGGRVTGSAEASLGGTLTVYEESLRYVRREGRISRVESREEDPDRDRGVSLGFGRTRFTVRAGTNYNRIEGLPVLFGPVITTAGSNPLRIEALAIWRTDQGFDLDTDEMGYFVRLEQALGGRRSAWLGGTVHSTIEPIERWGLTDLEASLATFVLHKDYRDYFERDGWSVYGRLDPVTLPLSFRVEFRQDDHRFAPVGGPWSITDNDDPWRPQPLVAEGRLESVAGQVTLDTRNDIEEPSDGWYVTGRARLGVGGSMQIPEHFEPTVTDPTFSSFSNAVPATSVDTDFATGFLDVRRYLRIDPGSSLALRAVVAGTFEERTLPPQYQHAMGGEGSLPGFKLFSVDCGARTRLVELPSESATPPRQFPQYGCDRIALVQAEYRGRLFSLGWDDDDWDDDHDWDWHPNIDLSPSWAVFFDMGRGWALAPEGADDYRFDTETVKDIGVGLFIGDVGLFWAYPLDGEDKGVNFFIRLDHRF